MLRLEILPLSFLLLILYGHLALEELAHHSPFYDMHEKESLIPLDSATSF
jgi:hypothetical protein